MWEYNVAICRKEEVLSLLSRLGKDNWEAVQIVGYEVDTSGMFLQGKELKFEIIFKRHYVNTEFSEDWGKLRTKEN